MTDAATPITAQEVEAWGKYIGREETRRQVLDVETLRRFAASTDSPLDVQREQPPLAHWAYFLETARGAALGSDGHPKRGAGILPPIRLPRRMFAASAMRFASPLVLGESADLTLRLTDVKHRSGKSGDLIFLEVDRRLTQGGTERLIERQTIVYRGPSQPVASIEAFKTPLEAGQEIWTPGSVDLFRFSAVTFNAHRIHYDLPYAQDEEGYPGLVVHGPLTATKLFTFAQRRSKAPIRQFSFKAIAPLFAGQPVVLAQNSNCGDVQAIRCDGVIAISAKASTEDAP